MIQYFDFKKETILESDFSLINLDSYSNSNPILVANYGGDIMLGCM